MKIYEITIKPISGFGTPLKGDTIFGHFCWQIVHDETLIGRRLDDLLSGYQTIPFIIFSSAYPKFCVGKECQYALKTPPLPLDELFNFSGNICDKIKKRKDYKAKKWMILKEGQKITSLRESERPDDRKFLNDRELLEKAITNMTEDTRKQMKRMNAKNFMASYSQPHNTINRFTGTTGEGPFAPYSVEQGVFVPETELALFVGIDERTIDIAQVRTGLERMGETGFGKDSSLGLGRFSLSEDTEIDIMKIGSDTPNACYTLAPCVPEIDTYSEMFFTPFVRFGRHGDVLAKSGNPFKNPVIMADEGAIFKPKTQKVFDKPYIGRAITNISKAEPKTVAQGYSIYIPMRVEV